jgi:RNA-directed DNA polymerase
MTNGRGKSDSVVVAGKSVNKAEQFAAEPMERRAGAKGNVDQQSTPRAQNPGKRVTGAGRHTTSSKAKEEGTVHLAPPPRQH